jgi:hypothetical protein
MTVPEIIAKYPIKDSRWRYDAITSRFVVEKSDFATDTTVDPWKRDFPTQAPIILRDTSERNIIGWRYKTTVAGIEIECVVFND